LRWLLRYGSYLAVMIVVGVVLTDRFVWNGALERAVLRRAVRRALVAIGVLAAAQWLVLASDISGRAPWVALGSLDGALATGAGMAMAVRIMLAGAVWYVLMGTDAIEVRDTTVALASIGLLGTWAWAGHSATQRWPELGFPVDVVHHASAALWIGALLIVGVVAARRLAAADLAPVIARLSRVAAVCVGLIVGTGLVQSVRLVGSPGDLFAAAHGRYLAVKLLIVGVMLVVANGNRRRVQRGVLTPGISDSEGAGRLRRIILVEFAIGIVIVGITSAMVVSPPATSVDDATSAPREQITRPSYYAV
jgi:copper transport protein